MQFLIQNYKSKILNLPRKPGVYQFLNKGGEVVYIGKAKNLRSRMGQYFNGSDERPQLPFLMAEAVDFSYTVVSNELESVFLENTLIKKYLPRYNIMLRDDKNYAFIKIDYSTEIPQIGYARKVEARSEYNELYPNAPKHKHSENSDAIRRLGSPKYFGPYSAAYKIRNTLNLVRKIFPFCANTKVGARPCFYYYMHRCPGVCIGKITLDEYRRHLDKIIKFLKGETGEITKEIKIEMAGLAKRKKFEAAARLRDQLKMLELLQERQNVILPKKVDWDLVSLTMSEGYACVNLFKVREGKLFDKENFVYELPEQDFNGRKIPAIVSEEVLQTFLERYYLETSSLPKEIFLQNRITNYSSLEQILHSRSNKKVNLFLPKKGKHAKLIKLGSVNAEEYLKKWLTDQAGHLDKINNALTQLKDVLKLAQIPKRIECYDISNIQGTNAVGSMVVFENGLPKKSQYRKFRIKTKKTPDDFAMMKEMLSRRFSHDGWDTPDLVVIDGGKGQLNTALEALRKFQMTNSKFQIIGLAKRIEEIFTPGKSEPIILSHDEPALQLLQRLRDEAHRFGITYHRALRSKQAVRSALDDIPGIGPKTKKLLKTKFGTISDIKKSGTDELAKVVGEKLAKIIKQAL